MPDGFRHWHDCAYSWRASAYLHPHMWPAPATFVTSPGCGLCIHSYRCEALPLRQVRGVKTINVVRRSEQVAELLALG